MRDAFMVGLVLAAVWFVEKCLTTPMVFRPIVVGPLVGLVLGDVKMGILCGATLETVFMGAIQVGSAVPPDPMIGAGVGTALAINTSDSILFPSVCQRRLSKTISTLPAS